LLLQAPDFGFQFGNAPVTLPAGRTDKGVHTPRIANPGAGRAVGLATANLRQSWTR
jgi:hypothetical protein